MTDQPPNLYDAISAASSLPWSFCVVGDDQSRKLAELTRDLRRPHSTSGAGKRISSGFLYWGVDPTMEWVRACSDPFYPVMRDGIESFQERWAELDKHTRAAAYHYVSLGPGTGHKDHAILTCLLKGNKNLCYLPVDMSAEMLRLSVHEPIRSLALPPGRVIPVQIDFAITENASELRRLLQALLGDAPIVFSLLGNTLANFEDDVDLLQMLVQQLLHPDDLFVLEVATTQAATDPLAVWAADEYRGIGAFAGFVTSTLHSYTDLTIDLDNVLFIGEVEEARALRLKVLYANKGPDDLRITLPGRVAAEFRRDDTILLDITRKYTPAGLQSVLEAAGLAVVAKVPWRMHRERGGHRGFGVDILLLKLGERIGTDLSSALWAPPR